MHFAITNHAVMNNLVHMNVFAHAHEYLSERFCYIPRKEISGLKGTHVKFFFRSSWELTYIKQLPIAPLWFVLWEVFKSSIWPIS